MPAAAKVDSWLSRSSSQSHGEAYESGSESSASASSSRAAGAKAVDSGEDDGETEGEDEDARREEDVDWDEVMPKFKAGLMDRSKKRRDAFISRYLYVSQTSPPPSQIPPLISGILSCLPLLTDPAHIDALVGILLELVKRDDKLEEASRLKLGAKLAKWVSVESDKAVGTTKSAVPTGLLPYLILVLGLLTTFKASRAPIESLVKSQIFADLVLSLLALTDGLEARERVSKSSKALRAGRKANIRIWRTLRTLRSALPSILQILLTKSTSNPARSAVLIGHTIGVLLRLKPTNAEVASKSTGREVLEAEKEAVVTYYTTHILGSKIALPSYTSTALREFLREFVSYDVLSTRLLPTAEKMLLRSPEIALELTADLLDACDHDISQVLPGKLIPAALSASKSANSETRSKAITLVKAISKRFSDEKTMGKIVTEILALPKTGKTASPEHRVCLLDMTASLAPSDKVSPLVVDTLAPLFSKESNEPALAALAAALEPHLAYTLSGNVALSSATGAALAKDLGATRPTSRRALAGAIGDAIWKVHQQGGQYSTEGQKLLDTLVPALETSLTTAAANQPINAAGFMEGFVVISLALCPLHNLAAGTKLGKNSVFGDLLAMSPKPSFLLNDKIRARLPTADDEKWLLRSIEGVLQRYSEKITTGSLRTAIGLAPIYLAVEGHSPYIRRQALAAVSEAVKQQPKLVSRIFRDALTSWFKTQEEDRIAAKLKRAIEEDDTITPKSKDIGRLLSAIFQPSADKLALEDIAVDFVILAHHPEVGDDAQVSWISVVQSLGLNPASVAVDRREKIMKALWDSAGAPAQDARMAQAAYRAVTTLTFIQPEIYLPAVLEKIASDLDPSSMDFIGLEERGIWATPADQLFVDVLAPKKDAVENKNRKDYATEKWEQEVRESLAKKKTNVTGAKLSKADQALVTAQKAKEAGVRTRIATLQAQLDRGVDLISSLVAANSEPVALHIKSLAELLLNSVFGPGSFLVEDRVFGVFVSLGTLVSPKLGQYRSILTSAILRSHNVPHVDEDYLDEPISDLVTRLLHQLDFVAQQTPLDSATFSLASLLLARVTELGGVGTESAQSDEAQEQLTLVVNIIASCCGEFESQAYPRLQVIRNLFTIIGSYASLAKDAVSALVDIGASIKDNATLEETRELIAGTLSKDPNVRNGALQALQPVDITELDYSQELWIALHDSDEQNANLALHLWEDNGLDIPEGYLGNLLQFLAHDSPAVRNSTAGALAAALEHFPGQIDDTVLGLQALYEEKAKLLMPEYDRFGMVIPETVNRKDPFEARAAIALALEKLSPALPEHLIKPILNFLIVKEALGDRNSQVRRAMLAAATSIVDLHGASSVVDLMKMFEDYLGTGSASESDDYIKEAVVILFGRLARHLDASDDRIPKVVDRLVEALNIPSENVQSAVADCLPPLVHGMGEEVEYLVDKLFSTLTTSASYASRRGAAYGLAGVVKGRGLQSLAEYELRDKFEEAAQDKASVRSREGALLAWETLTATLGRAFEPYILANLENLLTLFGDGNGDVRDAAQAAAKVIMSKVSGHCVKLMLPILLDHMDDKQWRTKKGAIELLGAMAFCAPRQLSLSLPQVIPQLTGVINDSHAQVKSAANASLKRFGEVLENPEIKTIQRSLMGALADPTQNTEKALRALIKTRFDHLLDSPSLALIMPIIDRGLRDRSSKTKRQSVQIVGTMVSLTEPRDLTAYLDQIMPLVHEVLVDPVPETRATAAKSLGTLVERLGETNFPHLVDDLLRVLRSETSGVDRQGAAQGLSEVLSGLGMEKLEGLLPEVISSTASPRPYVREGFISLLVYLPATFGHRFAPHLGRVIPPILNGLSDNSEYVREQSMRAGKMIIANYSNKAIDLLLPELEKGMLDPSWRIRSSSISLTGDLLYRVTGISGKVELDEEDAPAHSADNARRMLLEALGQERRDRILATLYIVRQDTVNVVRSASIHIWKALVQNTPRTTREILPVLVQLIMSLLGSPEEDQQATASRTLGELCRKNGERILGDIIPILQKAITSQDARTKEGACLAFADVMAASNKDAVADHEDAIISSIRTALVDSDSTVRAAAARTFDTMQHYMGVKAIDQTIPTLLEAMRNPGETSETALQALQEVMSVRANTVFPVLIPTLTAQPITAFNARALGALVKVAGAALNRRLDSVLGALAKSLETEKSEDVRGDLLSAVKALLTAVVDEDGVHQLQMLLISWAKDHNPIRRATGCSFFGTACQVNAPGYAEDYRVDWTRILISLFDDSTEDVIAAAWKAFDQFVKKVPREELEDLAVPVRRALESAGAPGRKVPGLSRPKGAESIVPILIAGLLTGTQEQKEQAALGIGELVQKTSDVAIKPYIIQLTGPLIRAISMPISPQIKSAILLTLTVLLEEVPQLVKPFHPQLTRTFVKSVADPSALSVRSRAATGLGELMKHQLRVDPLVTELIGGVRTGDSDIAPAMATALAAVFATAGKNIGPAAREASLELVESAFAEGKNDAYNSAMARIVSSLAKYDPENIRSIVDVFLTPALPPTPLVTMTVFAILEDAPEAFYDLDVVEDIIKKVLAGVGSDIGAIARPARDSRELMRKIKRYEEDTQVQALLR